MKSNLIALASTGFILSVSISVLTAPPASALIGELKETLSQKLNWLVGSEEPAPAEKPAPSPSGNGSSQPSQSDTPPASSQQASEAQPSEVNPAEPETATPIAVPLPPSPSAVPKLNGTVAGVSTIGYAPDSVNLDLRGGAVGAAAVPFEVIYPSDQGWVILGLAWYWWLAGLSSAAIIAQGARHYYQPDQKAGSIRAIKS